MSKKTQRGELVPRQAREAIAASVHGSDGRPAQGVQRSIIKVLGVQRPLVLAYVRRLRSKAPQATAEQLALLAERDYLRTVTGTGAAGGASAVIPGVGTLASLGISAGVTVLFLEASALYAQTMAELHGVAVEDPEHARALVMAVMLGDEAAGLLAGVSEQIVSGKAPGTWGAAFAVATGRGGSFSGLAKELQARFLRHLARTQTAGLLGRAMPFGIGAAVGGISSRVLGRRVVRSARSAFAALPPLGWADLDRAVAQAPSSEAEVRRLVAAEASDHEELRRQPTLSPHTCATSTMPSMRTKQ